MRRAKHEDQPADSGDSNDGDSVARRGGGDISVKELLGIELARIRSRFAVDPVIAGKTLAPAWIGGVPEIEEDEAEFRDAMADCVGAGLPLETALDCWHTRDLAYLPDGADADEPGAVEQARDPEDEDETTQPIAGRSAPGASPHRRVFVR